MAAPGRHAVVQVEHVARRILVVRGLRVMLDRDLAELYGVRAIALRQQVKRNTNRFPADFMFQLTAEEADFLVSQRVIPSGRSLGGSLPYAFTQEGVAMLSSVLRSPRAVEVNIAIMRAFIRLRQLAAAHHDLAERLNELERTSQRHTKAIKIAFKLLRDLMAPPHEPEDREPIGFRSPKKPE
ncbi:MAG: ORF6N domain-containing protein [Planctomycetota bacterium]